MLPCPMKLRIREGSIHWPWMYTCFLSLSYTTEPCLCLVLNLEAEFVGRLTRAAHLSCSQIGNMYLHRFTHCSQLRLILNLSKWLDCFAHLWFYFSIFSLKLRLLLGSGRPLYVLYPECALYMFKVVSWANRIGTAWPRGRVSS